MVKYKVFSILLILSLIIFNFSGCKNSYQSSNKKEIVFGQMNNRMPLDVTKSALLQTREMSDTVFEGLIAIDSKTGDKIPCLSESYDVSEDKKEYIFYLKEGVKFHNNQTFTAKDVKFSIERILSKETASVVAPDLLSIKGARDMLDGNTQTTSGIEIIDDYTIKIINDEAFVTFLDCFCLIPIYPETVCSEAGEKWGSEVIVGTGPFEVESFDMDYGCRVKKFENYHGQMPLIDSIYFKFFDELNTMMIDYEAENVDFLILSDKVANEYINNEKYKSHIKIFDAQAVYFIILNVDKEPWNNKKIREAFSYAIDINSICKDLTNNKIIPSGCLSIPKADGYNPDMKAKNYNPEKSLQILKDAGINVPLKAEIPVSTLESWSGQIIVALQDQAKSAGFEISTPIMDRALLNDLKHSGLRPAGIGSWFFNFPNMDQVFYTFFHSTTSLSMSSCYKNKEFDDMIEKARKTFDTSELAQIYKNADKKIVSEDVAAIPIGYPKEYYMIQPWIKNFEIKSLKYPFEYCDVDLLTKNKAH